MTTRIPELVCVWCNVWCRVECEQCDETKNRDLTQGDLGNGVNAEWLAGRLPMSALGHKRTFHDVCRMSALPPKADIHRYAQHVRFVPKADIASFDQLVSTAKG